MRLVHVTLLVGACAALARPADAFLLLGKSKEARHDATTVVLMREGERTVLTVQAHYRGPAEPLVLVVPVPGTAPAKADPLPRRDLVPPLTELTGPRLSELWEQNPCELDLALPGAPEENVAEDAGARQPAGADPWAGLDFELTAVAKQAELAELLKSKGFELSKEGGGVLEELASAGYGFVVAQLDGSKLPLAEDQAWLPPLRIHFDAKQLVLPSRLAAASGRGAHDLDVYVLAPGSRYEAADAPNLALPTNLVVTQAVKGRLPELHDALRGWVHGEQSEAVVTEYAWSATSCSPCVGQPLSADDLPAYGSDELLSAAMARQLEVLVKADAVATAPDGPADARARLEECYGRAWAADRKLAGEVQLDVTTGPSGEATSIQPRGNAPAPLAQCATEALRGALLGKKQASGLVTLAFVPRSRAFAADFVLTHLRARLGKLPDKDLALRPGQPIEGGREIGVQGEAEQKVSAAEQGAGDNYQARYVIRHSWEGKIECESPKRGVWKTSPPEGAAPKAEQAQAKPLVLKKVIQGDLPDLKAFALSLAPGTARPAPSARPPAPSAPPPPPASASAGPPAGAPPASGCGCRTAPSAAAGPSELVALACLLGLRARRRRCR